MASLTAIAENILAHAKKLDAYAAEHGLKTSIDDRPSWRGIPSELEESRAAVVDLGDALTRVAREPGGILFENLFRFTDVATSLFLYHFKVPPLVPVEGSISYSELAQKLNIREAQARRFLQNAMVVGMFKEDPADMDRVMHTADSRTLAEDTQLFEAIGLLLDEMLPSFINLEASLRKWPLSQETNQAGFSLANNTEKTMYETFATDPGRSKRFGGAMGVFNRETQDNITQVHKRYEWEQLDTLPGALVVDLGGSLGHISIALARATKNVTFEVQDLPKTAEAGEQAAPKDLMESGRLRFRGHNFLVPQPKPEHDGDAVDVFFVAQTFQNWPDKYVVQILRNLIPAMRKGSKVLVWERVMPEHPKMSRVERNARSGDMLMSSLLNGQLRTSAQWGALFSEADERFNFIGVRRFGIDRGVVEAIYGARRTSVLPPSSPTDNATNGANEAANGATDTTPAATNGTANGA